MQNRVIDAVRLRAATSLRHVEYHAALESTSTTACTLLPSLLPVAPAIVIADEQTAGRGRSGNAWWSNRGALTFSLVLDADSLPLATARRPLVALATGLAVRDSLEHAAAGMRFGIKWPNDVLASSQKICGVLAEQSTVDDRAAIVLGIGVNVNNSLSEAPTEVAQRATSLFDLTGRTFDLTQLLIDLLNRLDVRILQLGRQPRLLLAEINAHNVLTGRQIVVRQGDDVTTGQCLGVDDDGQLVLRNESGLVRVLSGVVSRW